MEHSPKGPVLYRLQFPIMSRTNWELTEKNVCRSNLVIVSFNILSVCVFFVFLRTDLSGTVANRKTLF